MDSEDNSNDIPWWDIIGHLEAIVSNVKTTASNIISSVSDSFADLKANMAELWGDLYTWINTFREMVGDKLNNFISLFNEWFRNLEQWWQNLITSIGNWFTSVGQWFVDLNNFLNEKFDNMLAWIKLNFFTVDMDRVFETVDFKGKLERKFGIFFEVGEALTGLKDKSVEAAAEPKIQVTLPEFLGGSTVTVLDLTQFADIFAYGKMLLRGILWLGFAKWLLEYFSPKMSI